MIFRTLLVEDHATMRATLTQFISGLPEIEFLSAVQSGEEALDFCQKTKPELVLIDVSLPGISGIDLVPELKRLHPDLHCLMLSGHQEAGYIRRALDNGASGYVLKGDPFELQDAITAVTQGKVYISEAVQRKLSAFEKKHQPNPF